MSCGVVSYFVNLRETAWKCPGIRTVTIGLRPLATCTVWLAVDDSLISNGCLRVIRGSHRSRQLFSHHTDNREHLALTHAVDDECFDEKLAADIELCAGLMSMHDVFLIHGSNQNKSDQRRAGIAIRYIPASSVFRRGLMEPSSDSGYMIDFSQRPLWLLRAVRKNKHPFPAIRKVS